MPFILRIDVDKPYGRVLLAQRVMSKLREDFWFPAVPALGFGRPAARFARYLRRAEIPAVFFFRLCTLPSKREIRKLISMGHCIGLHAENTRSDETFRRELGEFTRRSGLDHVPCFSKHGSGEYKLGRHHYPPYEEEKYLRWADDTGVCFPSGNGQLSSLKNQQGEFFKEAFWLHPDYRDTDRFTVDWALEQGSSQPLVLLMHPENYFAIEAVRRDLDRIIEQASARGIAWTTAPFCPSGRDGAV